MNRTLKQLLYGTAYLALIAIVVFGVYRVWFYKAPTCSDNIQNGSETGVDCNGPCVPCAIKNLKLDTSEAPRVFQGTTSQSILFVKIINPSNTYGVKSFSYSIQIWSVLGVPIKTINGKSYILPGETRYLVFPDLPSDSRDVGRISPIELSGVEWTPGDALVKYDLEISGVASNLSVSGGEVDGAISNNSPSNIPLIHMTALLFDVKGNIVSVSAATVQNLAAFSKNQFQVYFPPLGRAESAVDKSKTKVFYEVVKS